MFLNNASIAQKLALSIPSNLKVSKMSLSAQNIFKGFDKKNFFEGEV